MAISEDQLETWSHQGSVQQSAATYQTIKSVLESPQAPYANRKTTPFLQGSYGNNTNVWAESDVDVAICLTSVYYSDTESLNADEKARYDANWSSANYSFKDFKADVLAWLQENFGNSVTPGKKAIKVPGDGSRREVDVLACVQNRDYYSYPASGRPGYHEGICFWTSNGEKIVNYPHQHMSNCTSMHQATNSRFKPSIRVLKNMRRSMVSDGYIVSVWSDPLLWGLNCKFLLGQSCRHQFFLGYSSFSTLVTQDQNLRVLSEIILQSFRYSRR